MRIAFISIGDPRDVRVWSGIPFYVMQELERQAVSLEVIAPLQRTFKYLYAPASLLHRARHTQLQFDRHPLALRSYARQIERRLRGTHADAILCMSSVPITHLRTDIPVFFWTDAVLEGMAGYYAGPFAGLTRGEIAIGHQQEQAALNSAECAIYSSSWAARIVREQYTTLPDNVAVIEFGANLEITHNRAHVEALTERRRLQRPAKLLFLGVDWKRKGGALALEATRLLNERGIPCTLQVAGCASPASAFVENFGFISKTTEAGKRQLEQLLTDASHFLFPTRSEAAGIVFAEASAFGLPVITTATGGVSSYIAHGENGLVLPIEAGPEAYADAVEHTLADAPLYHRLSLAGFDRYLRVLNWSSAVQKLLHLVETKAAAKAGHAFSAEH